MKNKEKKNYSMSKAYERAYLYLTGKRIAAITKLTREFGNDDKDFIASQMSEDIKNYIKHQMGELKGSIKIAGGGYKIISKFNLDAFKRQVWKFVPYHIPQSDYDKIQATVKYPIALKRYDGSAAIYKFKNSVKFLDNIHKEKKLGYHMKNDVQFYMSKTENMLFSKTISIKYKPANLTAIKKVTSGKTKEESRKFLHDSFLYTRSLAICLDVYLDGDVKKGVPVMRYDNGSHVHTNVFLEGDKRKGTLGDNAENPHFHFLNEKDSLLCLAIKNFKQDRFMPGRCNAIDCKHLAEYLKQIDLYDKVTLANEKDDDRAYNMPFLDMKINKTPIEINVDNIVEKYIKKHGVIAKEKLSKVSVWLEYISGRTEYTKRHGRIFGDLIKVLDFIDYITTLMKVEVDYDVIKMLSDLEIMLANKVMEGINYIDNSHLITKYGSIDLHPEYEKE